MAKLPYLASPGTLKNGLERIRSAATPDRVTQDFISTKLQIKGGSGFALLPYYETFYCLEKSIRAFVSNIIEEAERTDAWWASARVPVNIKTEVAARIRREIDTGMTRRSTNELEYTTLGELTTIITSNWDIFGGSLSSEKAVTRVMSSLNSLRGPVAHCSPLAEDEVVRLQLAVRDWFRLME
jgi:hypothetical protein